MKSRLTIPQAIATGRPGVTPATDAALPVRDGALICCHPSPGALS